MGGRAAWCFRTRTSPDYGAGAVTAEPSTIPLPDVVLSVTVEEALMKYRSLLLAAAFVVPAALGAQRGASVGREDPMKYVPGEIEPPTMPAAKEMEKGTPAAVLLDKKKKKL